MPTNWPPATAPSWPPPEIGNDWFSASDLRNLVRVLIQAGFTQESPTSAENTEFFNSARCDHNHQVIGRMLISTSGTRYPFAICNNSGHRDLLVLWPPYYAGFGSGLE
jgi:hypothetical protein